MTFGRTFFIALLGAGYLTGLHQFADLAQRQAAAVGGYYDVGRVTASAEAGCSNLCR